MIIAKLACAGSLLVGGTASSETLPANNEMPVFRPSVETISVDPYPPAVLPRVVRIIGSEVIVMDADGSQPRRIRPGSESPNMLARAATKELVSRVRYLEGY